MGANANVVYSQKGGRVLVRFSNGSGYVNTVANSTVNSDIGSPGNEQTVGAVISGIWFSVLANSTGGGVTISRGANTIMNLVGTDHWTVGDGWRSEGENPTANIVVTFASGSNGCLFLELTKVGAGDGFQT